MSYICVLVSSTGEKPLRIEHLERAAKICGAEGGPIIWLKEGKGAEFLLKKKPTRDERSALEDLLFPDRIDSFVVSAGLTRKKKLLISDMDNTMVVGETLDDLADACGLRDRIAEITTRAMAGELDFPSALKTRISMLKGLRESALTETFGSISYMEGAETLVKTMLQNGAKCVLVSGGFTSFTEPVASKLGFHAHHGNVLDIENGVLTGQIQGPILDHRSKLQYLRHYISKFSLTPEDVLAVGDGANDLDMIKAAGLGIGFHPKPYLKERVENSILYGDLTTLLYVQGYNLS
jgi:phosphoserine phosphatase